MPDAFIRERLDSLHEVDRKIVALLDKMSTIFQTYTAPKSADPQSQLELRKTFEEQTKTIYNLVSTVAIDLRKEVKVMDDNIGVYDRNDDAVMILPISVDQKNSSLGKKKLKHELDEMDKLIELPATEVSATEESGALEDRSTATTDEGAATTAAVATADAAATDAGSAVAAAADTSSDVHVKAEPGEGSASGVDAMDVTDVATPNAKTEPDASAPDAVAAEAAAAPTSTTAAAAATEAASAAVAADASKQTSDSEAPAIKEEEPAPSTADVFAETADVDQQPDLDGGMLADELDFPVDGTVDDDTDMLF